MTRSGRPCTCGPSSTRSARDHRRVRRAGRAGLRSGPERPVRPVVVHAGPAAGLGGHGFAPRLGVTGGDRARDHMAPGFERRAAPDRLVADASSSSNLDQVQDLHPSAEPASSAARLRADQLRISISTWSSAFSSRTDKRSPGTSATGSPRPRRGPGANVTAARRARRRPIASASRGRSPPACPRDPSSSVTARTRLRRKVRIPHRWRDQVPGRRLRHEAERVHGPLGLGPVRAA